MKNILINFYIVVSLLVVGLGMGALYGAQPKSAIIDLFSSQSAPFDVVEEGTIIKKYHVYFSDEIVASPKYNKLYHFLRTREEGEVVTFHLSNYGGSWQAGLQITNAVQESKAHIIMSIDSNNYSMGAMLACVGDDIIVNNDTKLMYHDGSTSKDGKVNERIRDLISLHKQFKSYLQRYCVKKNILTNAEVNSILSGVDLYIHSDELKKRLKK